MNTVPTERPSHSWRATALDPLAELEWPAERLYSLLPGEATTPGPPGNSGPPPPAGHSPPPGVEVAFLWVQRQLSELARRLEDEAARLGALAGLLRAYLPPEAETDRRREAGQLTFLETYTDAYEPLWRERMVELIAGLEELAAARFEGPWPERRTTREIAARIETKVQEFAG